MYPATTLPFQTFAASESVIYQSRNSNHVTLGTSEAEEVQPNFHLYATTTKSERQITLNYVSYKNRKNNYKLTSIFVLEQSKGEEDERQDHVTTTTKKSTTNLSQSLVLQQSKEEERLYTRQQDSRTTTLQDYNARARVCSTYP